MTDCYSFEKKKNKNSTLSNFFPEFILFYFPDFFQVWKTGSPVSRRFQESKVAFDWKIWMHILKSGLWICNRTRKTDFTSEKSVLKVDFNYEIQIRIFCISFFTACLGNPKNGFAKLSREQWSFFCYNYDCALETVVQR